MANLLCTVGCLLILGITSKQQTLICQIEPFLYGKDTCRCKKIQNSSKYSQNNSQNIWAPMVEKTI